MGKKSRKRRKRGKSVLMDIEPPRMPSTLGQIPKNGDETRYGIREQAFLQFTHFTKRSEMESPNFTEQTVFESPNFTDRNLFDSSNFTEQNGLNTIDSARQPILMKPSCSSCLLCYTACGMQGNGCQDDNNVSSCSICVWDVDDNKRWDGGNTLQCLSDDDSDPSRDYYKGHMMTLRSRDDNMTQRLENKLHIDGNRFDSYRMNVEYTDIVGDLWDEYDEDVITTIYGGLGSSILRTSPDGGENISDHDDCFDAFASKSTSTSDLPSLKMATNNLIAQTVCNMNPNESDKPSIFDKHDKQTNRHVNNYCCEERQTNKQCNVTNLQNLSGQKYRMVRCLTCKKHQNRNGGSVMRRSWSLDDFTNYHKPTGLSNFQSTYEPVEPCNYFDDVSSNMMQHFEDEGLNEQWAEYLDRIGGSSAYIENKSLRYIWQQTTLYHNHLLQPLEEFLKGNLERSQQMETNYKDLEYVLEQRTEQQEKVTAKIYNDVEQAIQKEREQLQQHLAGKDELVRKELEKLMQMEEEEVNTLVHQNETLSEKLKQLEDVHSELKTKNCQIELQSSILAGDNYQLKKENQSLVEMNEVLLEKVKNYDSVFKEQEELVCHLNKEKVTMDEKYRETKQLRDTLTEENEFLKLNISTISVELEEVKVKNKQLKEQASTHAQTRSYYLGNNVDSSDHDDEVDGTFVGSYGNEVTSTSHVIDSLAVISSFDDKKTYQRSTSLMEEVKQFMGENSHVKRKIASFDSIHFNDPNTSRCRLQNGNAISDRTPLPNKETNGTPATSRKNSTISKSYSLTKSPIRLASRKQSDYKIIFMGDCNVGKTTLIRRICYGKFRPVRDATFEPDCSTFEIPYNDDVLKLKLWDTMGQERFNSIPPSYFRKSDIVILMYDITEEISFINAKTWIRTIHDHTDENIFIILVASKCDLHHKRMVCTKRGQRLAVANDAMFVETSAKSGESIDRLCDMMASSLGTREETLLIRKDFEGSLCSLSYSMSRPTGRVGTACCST